MVTPLLELRPYQLEALARVEAAEARGARSLLGVAATGLGKTIMFVQLIRRRGGRAVVLVHRDELVNQAVIKLCEAEPTRPVTDSVHSVLVNAERFDLLEDRIVSYSMDSIGIVKAAADDVGSQIVVASVQTLRQARLERLVNGGVTLSTVVVDEAHHVKADTYLRVLEWLQAGWPDGPLLFGVTATPERGDGQGLADVFDEVAFNYDILWGIRAGYLSDLRARRIVLEGFNVADLKVSRGDYTEASSGRALEDADAPRHIVAGWMSEAMGRKTLVFCPTVALTEQVCEAFKSAGVRAAWVSGTTPMDERRAMLGAFHDGDVQVMVNCMVLTEGYDEPSIECIVVARPTKKQGLYVQMVGRGTRRYPGKDDCLVLDVVGATAMHSLVTVPSLFGLEDDDDVVRGDKLLSDGVADHQDKLIAAGRLAARDAELFKTVAASNIPWVDTTDPKTGLAAYMRTLGSIKRKGEVVYLPTVRLIRRSPSEDSWVCGLQWSDGRKRVLIDRVPLTTAMAVGEDFVRKSPNQHLMNKDAGWRKKPATQKQKDLAAKWRLVIPDGMTAGEASAFMDKEIAAKKAASAARKARRG